LAEASFFFVLFASFVVSISALNGTADSLHRRCDTLFSAKNRRTGDQNVGPDIDYQRRSRRVDAAINLEVAPRPELIDHLAHSANLRQRAVDEMLLSKARVNRHNQHLIHVLDDLF
jgi:hypothetical protein